MNSSSSRQLVAQHLRELPNTALDAALDLAAEHGPCALVRVITDEFARRHARHSIRQEQEP